MAVLLRDELHVVVTDCGDGTWEWEICRRGEPLSARMRDGPFKSQELGELQQSNLGPDNLLLGGHGVLQSAEAGRFATPTAPRPRLGSRFAVGPGHLRQIKF
jgi:hypothetical protein